jgi:hypothetical protein
MPNRMLALGRSAATLQMQIEIAASVRCSRSLASTQVMMHQRNLPMIKLPSGKFRSFDFFFVRRCRR